jgi:hypothetical protein
VSHLLSQGSGSDSPSYLRKLISGQYGPVSLSRSRPSQPPPKSSWLPRPLDSPVSCPPRPPPVLKPTHGHPSRPSCHDLRILQCRALLIHHVCRRRRPRCRVPHIRLSRSGYGLQIRRSCRCRSGRGRQIPCSCHRRSGRGCQIPRPRPRCRACLARPRLQTWSDLRLRLGRQRPRVRPMPTASSVANLCP